MSGFRQRGPWLADLRRKRSVGRYLPDEVRIVIQAYGQESGDFKVLQNGQEVASILLEVWRQTIRKNLLEAPFNLGNWCKAIIPVARYLEPAGLGHPPRKRDELAEAIGSERFARERLIPEDRVQIRAIQEKIDELARSKSTYHDYESAGIEQLEGGIAKLCRALKSGQSIYDLLPNLPRPRSTEDRPRASISQPGAGRAASVWPDLLPDPYVERVSVLKEVRRLVLRTAGKGGWIGICGLPGTGTSTLLAAFLRDVRADKHLQRYFAGRVAFVTLNVGEKASDHQVQQEALRLLNELASGLGIVILEGEPSLLGRAEALLTSLREQGAIIVVDNVLNRAVLNWLKSLPPGVVGVLATPLPEIAEYFATNQRTITLGGLERKEAEELAVKTAGRPQNQSEKKTMQELLQAVDFHPLAVRLLGEQARGVGWSQLRKTLPITFPVRDNRSSLGEVDQVLAMVWQALSRDVQRRLALLCGLPLFDLYDADISEAVWATSRESAQKTLKYLADYGLIGPFSNDGRFRLHSLVRRQGRKHLRFWDWGRLLMVGARYPLHRIWPAWKWWGTSVPRAPWPCRGRFFLPEVYLAAEAWPRNGPRLSVPPAEWAVVQRCTAIQTMALLWISVSLIIYWLAHSLLLGLIMAVPAIYALIVHWWNVHRIACWRTGGRSFLETIGQGAGENTAGQGRDRAVSMASTMHRGPGEK